MNSVLKITVVCAAAAMLHSSIAFADTYISDKTHTTAVDLSCGTSEILNISDTNSTAVTRDGFLIMSPEADAVLTVYDGSENRDINVLPPINFDFDDDITISDVAEFQKAVISEQDDNKYLNGTNEPAVLNFKRTDINSGALSLKFRLLKENTLATDFIYVKSEQNSDICRVSVSSRNTSQVYFSYQTADGTVRMRTTLMDIGKWLDAEFIMDFAQSKASLYINNSLFIDDIPLLDTENGVSSVSFGENIDNLVMSSGLPIDECSIDIGLENIIEAAGNGMVMIDPLVTLEFLGGSHVIDAKYCNFSVMGNEIMSSDSKIIADLSVKETSVTARASCVISGVVKENEKEISIISDDNGEVYPSLDTISVYTPEKNVGSVTFKAYNGGKEKTLIALLTDGKECISIQQWTVKSGGISEKSIEFDSNYSDQIKVYLIDTDTMNDLLISENVA